MSKELNSIIKGTGSYIPTRRIKNEAFLFNDFYDRSGKSLDKTNQEVIDKFYAITSIKERRYVTGDMTTSDIAYYAAQNAIESANIDRETLDYIIVAHNFGDVRADNKQLDMVPSLAARVKHHLEIENPATVAFDLPFGCAGWLEGMIHADAFIKSGNASKVLVIGAELLSRVSDPHDRDSMLYADGAGAVVLEAESSGANHGILAHKSRSDALHYSKMLFIGPSNNPQKRNQDDLYLKMNGQKLYQYAIEKVPYAIKACLEKSNLQLNDINRILIHQANGKMDEAILSRLFKLYHITNIPKNIMPMTIEWLGNSSVATLPTLLDLIWKGKMNEQQLNNGDAIVFASVGAGMNINALTYKV